MSEENKINSVTSSVDTGTSVKFIGESDSTGNNLRIEDGKLSGTIVGSVIKDFTGRVDDVTLELSNVPIDGVGGGSSSSIPEVAFTIAGDEENLSCTCDTSYDELVNIANTKHYCLARYFFTNLEDHAAVLSDVRTFKESLSSQEFSVRIESNVLKADEDGAFINYIRITAKDDVFTVNSLISYVVPVESENN